MKRNSVLYMDIAARLRQDIFSRRYPVGTLLPTENELEEQFGVSKITIRKAIELLAQEELVEKKSGKGTTVLSDRPYNKLSKTTSFTKILEHSHHDIEKRLLSLDEIVTDEDSELRRCFGKHAARLRRLYLMDGSPYIYLVHYLPASIADIDRGTLANDSLYRVLTQHGYAIERFSDDFLAIELTPEEQDILRTTSRIATKRVRMSYDGQGNAVEYCEGIYDTNRQPYRIEYDA